jgi:hypothetical protein
VIARYHLFEDSYHVANAQGDRMNSLIVHTDPEPHSFVSALRNAFAARATLAGIR